MMRSPPQSEQDVTDRVSGTYVAEKRVAGIQIDSDHQGDGAAGFFFADIAQDGYEGHLRNLKAALASAYRAGYAAAQTEVLRCFDRQLDAIFRVPEMFGSDEAVELQVLQLLQSRALVLRPDLESRQPRRILDLYQAFLRQHVPDERPFLLADRLPAEGRTARMVALLSAFRAQVGVA